MQLLNYVPQDGIIIDFPATSKKKLFEKLSDRAGSITGISSRSIFDALMQREKLGSTGVGGGIAIPHAVLSELEQSIILIGLLREGISFDAIDEKQVRIVVAIFGSKHANCDHLKLLSTAAKLLSSHLVRHQLLIAQNPADVRKCFHQDQASAA